MTADALQADVYRSMGALACARARAARRLSQLVHEYERERERMRRQASR